MLKIIDRYTRDKRKSSRGRTELLTKAQRQKGKHAWDSEEISAFNFLVARVRKAIKTSRNRTERLTNAQRVERKRSWDLGDISPCRFFVA